MSIKKNKERRSAVYAEMETLNTAVEGRDMTPEERSQWDALETEHNALTAEIEREERFQQIDARQQQPSLTPEQRQSEDDEARSAYLSYLRGGMAAVPQELRSLIHEVRDTATGIVDGAVTIPKSMHNAIEVAVKSIGGMLGAVDVIYTSGGGDLTMSFIDDTSEEAEIVGSGSSSDKADEKEFESLTLKAYTYRTPIVLLTYELLQDSAFNLEETIQKLLKEAFTRGLNRDITHGTGTNEPMGIVTAAEEGVEAAEDSITFQNILDLMAAVDPAYAENGSFMLNYRTLLKLSALEDSAGNPIWHSSKDKEIPSTIMGRPYVINNKMQDIGAEKCSLIFGDLKKYKVRIVLDFRTIRFGEKYADQLSVGLLGFGRADGQLLNAGTNPVAKLVHAEAEVIGD